MGEFLSPVGTISVFEQVIDRVMRVPDSDPKMAFRTATPGIIGELTQVLGAWQGRGDLRFELPGTTQGAKAVGPEERMDVGSDDIGHIVAKPGFALAGHSQRVFDYMFQYGGMTQERANALAAKPILDFNDEVSHIMLDVMTSGDYSGSQADAFSWSATDKYGNTVNQPLITDTANEVENVYAYGGQTFTHWPMRDGTLAAAGHDHLFDTGAPWTNASAQTQADNIREHPTNGRVRAHVGSTVAAAVQADLKSEYGGTVLVQSQVENNFSAKGAEFAAAERIGVRGSIEYFHVVDFPTNGALFVAAGKKPFHLNIGMVGEGGRSIEKRSWAEAGDPERGGTTWGFRDFVAAGVIDPLSVSYGEFAA